MEKLRVEWKELLSVVIGSILFAAGMNLFIVPMGYYSGGLLGVSQIVRTILMDILHIPIPANVEIAGILNFVLNIPLFMIAYKDISKRFFFRTLLSVVVQSITLTAILIPAVPFLEDAWMTCLVGGALCGVGIGLVLRGGGSGGGADILGVLLTQKIPGFSIGKMFTGFNLIVYALCAVLFNPMVALYSIIYSVIMSTAMDKIHYQNINMTVMIFTKVDGIDTLINQTMVRGVTKWDGFGSYTNEKTHVLVTVISKYEVSRLKKLIHSLDPKAFVIFNEGMSVSGNFEKRL